MARPLTEFIQSQCLSWTPARPEWGGEGAMVKVLSADTETGAATLLVNYPPGHTETRPAEDDREEEIFVLRGALDLGGAVAGMHFYAYYPSGGGPLSRSTDEGAIALRFIGPRVAGGSPRAAVIPPTDTTAMRWDGSNIDPEVDHLYTSRKNLRLAEDGTCRTYLLAGLPQGYPPSGVGRLERHPHVEEFFFVYGDMSCSVGVMRAGAYSWRPPMVWHGLDCSRSGFLIFFRSPGANRNTNIWAQDTTPIVWSPPHDPQLPPDMKRVFAEPLPDPVDY